MMKGVQVTGFWDLCLEMSMVLGTLMLITLMRQFFFVHYLYCGSIAHTLTHTHTNDDLATFQAH